MQIEKVAIKPYKGVGSELEQMINQIVQSASLRAEISNKMEQIIYLSKELLKNYRIGVRSSIVRIW